MLSEGKRNIHVRRCNRNLRRKEKHSTDESDPNDSHDVDGGPPSAQCEGALDELNFRFVDLMRENYRHVRDIQRGSCDVEDGRCGLCGSNSDAIEADAEEYHKPDRVNRGMSVSVHFGEETGDDMSVYFIH